MIAKSLALFQSILTRAYLHDPHCYWLIPLVKLIHPLMNKFCDSACSYFLNILHYLLFLRLSLKFVISMVFSSVTFASHSSLHHYIAASSHVNVPFFLPYYVSNVHLSYLNFNFIIRYLTLKSPKSTCFPFFLPLN